MNNAIKILFTPNWNVIVLNKDNTAIQAPDKYIHGEKYWFFKHFPKNTEVDVIDIGKKSYFQWIEKKLHIYFKQPFKAFLKRNNYDLIISHGAQSGLFYELLSSFCKRKPKHIMFDIGGLNSSRTNPFEMTILRFILRKKPTIIVHSSLQLGFYEKFYPRISDNVHFIPFGADVEYFNKHHSNCIEKTIISFGKDKRDYKTLCDAFCQLNNNEYKLQIIGDSRLQCDYKNQPNISFENPIPLKDLIERIKKCMFVIVPLPNYMYSYGQMTTLQSMALGKPLIITETTSTLDYITTAPGILKTRPNNITDMKDAILKMISFSDEQRQSMGQQNLNYVTKYFNEEQMGIATYELVRNTLGL